MQLAMRNKNEELKYLLLSKMAPHIRAYYICMCKPVFACDIQTARAASTVASVCTPQLWLLIHESFPKMTGESNLPGPVATEVIDSTNALLENLPQEFHEMSKLLRESPDETWKWYLAKYQDILQRETRRLVDQLFSNVFSKQ
jgi:hypothetical protein